MQIINVDRLNSLPGAGPFDHDRAIVVHDTETEPHIITGQPQRKILFRGTLAEAHAWVQREKIGCGCCKGPEKDRCCCHMHQDISRGLRAKICSRHESRSGAPKSARGESRLWVPNSRRGTGL